MAHWSSTHCVRNQSPSQHQPNFLLKWTCNCVPKYHPENKEHVIVTVKGVVGFEIYFWASLWKMVHYVYCAGQKWTGTANMCLLFHRTQSAKLSFSVLFASLQRWQCHKTNVTLKLMGSAPKRKRECSQEMSFILFVHHYRPLHLTQQGRYRINTGL